MRSVPEWKQALAKFLRIDRVVVAMYQTALLGFLLFPITGPGIRMLGIGSDKWTHVVLFGGLSVLLRWNFSEQRNPLFAAIQVGVVVTVATEVAQGLVVYRSAEFLDLLAGMLGVVLGAMIAARILLFAFAQRLLGLLVIFMGLTASALFLLADVIGVGDSTRFGTTQLGGTVLGAVISIIGIRVYAVGLGRCENTG